MNELVPLVAAAFAIDGLAWGFAGFFVFRALGGRRRWWVGILGTALPALATSLAVDLPLIRLLDLRIGNEEIAETLGTERLVDLLTFDPLSDVLVTVFAIAVGFLVAGFLDERRARREAERVAREGGAG